MGIMKRVSTIFQAKANSALNKAEDPARRSISRTNSSSTTSRR